jgi:hypothetical protein
MKFENIVLIIWCIFGVFIIGLSIGIQYGSSSIETQAITYLSRMSVPTGNCEPTKRWWKNYIKEHIGRDIQITAPKQKDIIEAEKICNGK